jgi:hypothetical protein
LGLNKNFSTNTIIEGIIMFQKNLISKILMVVICAMSLLLLSCKDDSNPLNPGGNGGGTAGQPTSAFGNFPVPDLGVSVGGVFGVTDIPITVAGVTFHSKMAFGGFYNSVGSPPGAFQYGGDVKINGSSMDTTTVSNNLLYLLPKTIGGSGQPAVTFDGTTLATFTMTGGVNSVPSFSAQIAPPVASALTAPAAGSTLAHTSALDITWDNATGTDTVMVIATDANGHSAFKKGILSSAGTVTLTTTDLASFSGSGMIYLVKYRLALTVAGAKTYAIIGQTVSFVLVTWS